MMKNESNLYSTVSFGGGGEGEREGRDRISGPTQGERDVAQCIGDVASAGSNGAGIGAGIGALVGGVKGAALGAGVGAVIGGSVGAIASESCERALGYGGGRNKEI